MASAISYWFCCFNSSSDFNSLSKLGFFLTFETMLLICDAVTRCSLATSLSGRCSMRIWWTIWIFSFNSILLLVRRHFLWSTGTGSMYSEGWIALGSFLCPDPLFLIFFPHWTELLIPSAIYAAFWSYIICAHSKNDFLPEMTFFANNCSDLFWITLSSSLRA